jgi:tRNA 2-selenouridine synthase
VLEDEGKHVGSRAVPLELRQRLEQAPIVYLHDTFEARVQRILRDYVVLHCADFAALLGPEAGFDAYAARLLASLDKLARRLGGDLHQRLRTAMQAALRQQQEDASVALHIEWITALLRHYYDPMYAYQRQGRTGRIVFEGDRAAVVEYLRERSVVTAR